MVLTSVSLIDPDPEPAALLIPATTALVQVKVVLSGMEDDGVYGNTEPVQVAAGVSVLVKMGVGLTVTLKLCALAQPALFNANA